MILSDVWNINIISSRFEKNQAYSFTSGAARGGAVWLPIGYLVNLIDEPSSPPIHFNIHDSVFIDNNAEQGAGEHESLYFLFSLTRTIQQLRSLDVESNH